MDLKWWAAIWGFAEATLFFIVPDVLLTAEAARSPQRALKMCVWAAVGALLGGTLMYQWAAADPELAGRTVERIPAVSRDMVNQVNIATAQYGTAAMLTGPMRGRPYKIYAIMAPRHGISLPMFLLISIPARIIRFLLLTTLASIAARTILRRLAQRQKITVILGCWALFYAIYFAVMPN